MQESAPGCYFTLGILNQLNTQIAFLFTTFSFLSIFITAITAAPLGTTLVYVQRVVLLYSTLPSILKLAHGFISSM